MQGVHGHDGQAHVGDHLAPRYPGLIWAAGCVLCALLLLFLVLSLDFRGSFRLPTASCLTPGVICGRPAPCYPILMVLAEL